jgi:hypothetical protein
MHRSAERTGTSTARGLRLRSLLDGLLTQLVLDPSPQSWDREVALIIEN